MRGNYWIEIKVGILILFFIIRKIYKSNNKPSELTISSTLNVDSNLIDKLQLKSGELVSLVNRPDTFEVLVSAKGISDRYEEIGVIEDRELAEKVKNNIARGKVEYVSGNDIKLALTY